METLPAAERVALRVAPTTALPPRSSSPTAAGLLNSDDNDDDDDEVDEVDKVDADDDEYA